MRRPANDNTTLDRLARRMVWLAVVGMAGSLGLLGLVIAHL